MIRLVATDMDGTFVGADGSLPKESFETIHQLSKEGILFAVASGRQTKTLEDNFEPVKDQIAIIAENGAVVQYKGKAVHTLTMPMEKVHQIVRDLEPLREEGINLLICCRDTAYYASLKNMEVKDITKYYHSLTQVESLLELTANDTVKIAVYDPIDITRIVVPFLEERWGQEFEIMVSGKNWVDICSKNIHKGIGIQFLQDKLDLKKEEIMAFGDYFNDVEMLLAAGESYAMEHAPIGVKKCAKYELPKGKVLEKIQERLLKKDE